MSGLTQPGGTSVTLPNGCKLEAGGRVRRITPSATPSPGSSGKQGATPHPRHVVGGVLGVAVMLAMIVKLMVIAAVVNDILSSAHEGVWTYLCAYGVVGLFAGIAMRWTSWWIFGLGPVLRPELYGAVGFWLIRLGVAVAAVGYAGYLVTRYVF